MLSFYEVSGFLKNPAPFLEIKVSFIFPRMVLGFYEVSGFLKNPAPFLEIQKKLLFPNMFSVYNSEFIFLGLRFPLEITISKCLVSSYLLNIALHPHSFLV